MIGTIFDIKEFAVHDGPGIRTTVFLKGCPLRCAWCHNPEGLSSEPQLMVSHAACTHCGACECGNAVCTACGACIAKCRKGLRRIAGYKMQAEELAKKLLRDRDLYEESGGGVTFSGGEPLLQWHFVREVVKQLFGVHTAIETSGFCPDEVFQEAMEAIDLFLIDFKHYDDAAHRRYTGVSNQTILRHTEALKAAGKPFILRMPIIPGVNDVEAHFEAAANLVEGAKGLIRVELLPYNRAAGAKYQMLGKEYRPPFDEAPDVRLFTAAFEKRGVPVLIR